MIKQESIIRKFNFKPADYFTKTKPVYVLFLFIALLLLFISSVSLAEGGGRYLSEDAWSFGVHGDTQWTLASNEANPNFITGSIITQVNDELIKHKVKFVIAIGDLSDRAQPGSMARRAKYAEPLYNAGIGFFPIRGNHETAGWLYNYAPVEAEASELLQAFPQTQKAMFGTYNISTPEILDGTENHKLKGLSYSFDYGPEKSNIRIIFMDTEDIECETTIFERNGIKNPFWPKKCKNYPIPSQQDWISEQVDLKTRDTVHAIVLSHRPPMGQNHTDSPFNQTTLFGEKPYYLNDNIEAQNDFFENLAVNNVKFYLGAHDHIHHRSIIKSPDGKSQVQEIIAAGLSTKFYEPAPIPNPRRDRSGKVTIEDQWFGQKSREISLSQEEKNIGYYIYTVDGPRMTADYYSDKKGNFQSMRNYPYGAGNPDYPLGVTPKLNFVKKETFGYSLNGKEFMVAQGGSYTVVKDALGKTEAMILSGVNNSTKTDANNRNLTKIIETGWVTNPDKDKLKSNVFSLWGMSELGQNDKTDVYVLSMSINAKSKNPFTKGKAGIATFVNGKWVNAVDENFGGKKKFVTGKYTPKYGLGTYGIDPRTKTAWAVLNYNADFAVALDIEP